MTPVVQPVQYSIRDRVSTWTPEMVRPYTTFDRAAYQKKLDEIARLTQAGESILMVEWCGNASWLKGEKNEFGQIVNYKPVPRFAIKSMKPETFGQPIPIRRWAILQNTDPGQLDAMGGKNHDVLKVEEKGFYTPWIFVGDHSKCQNCGQDGKTCFGDYKDPDDAELQYIIECTLDMLNDKNAPDPRKGVSGADAAAYLPPAPDEKEIEAKAEAENEEFIDDWIGTHGVARTSSQKPS